MGTENQDSQKKMEVRALTNLRDFLTTGAGKDLVIEYKQKGLIPATKVNSKL
jgi:glyoxylate reductase